MEVHSVVSLGTKSTVQGEGEVRKRRLDPFAGSTFHRGSAETVDLSGLRDEQNEEELNQMVELLYPTPEVITIRTPSGIRAQSPALSDAHRRALVQSISHMTDDERKDYEEKQLHLGRMLMTLISAQLEAEKAEEDRIQELNLPDPEEFLRSNEMRDAAVDPFVAQLTGPATRDYEAQVNDALIGGLWGFENAIREYVLHIDREQKMADEIRADMAELEALYEEWPEGVETQEFTYHEFVEDENGHRELVQKTVVLTKDEIQDLWKSLEEQDRVLATFGPAEQQVIQMVTQGWQQAMTTLSNVMKHYDETMRNILTNAKA